MFKNKTQQVVAAGVMLAAGLILPWFTAHAFGVPGTVLLPMHIPILLCGLICGPRAGAACGVLVPVLSCMLTGMPPLYPMLPIMAVQLLVMGAVSGFAYQGRKLPIYPSLLLSIASGWIIYGFMFSALMFADSGIRALPVITAIVQGIPGTAVQLVLIPIFVTALKRYMDRNGQDAGEDDGLAEALRLIKSGEASCVVIKNGAVIHTADGRGVSPLLKLHENEPEMLKNAFVVDKIIGKAAAMILVLGGAARVYGMVMSAAGREYLEQRGIRTGYGRCVDIISNRDQTGICPIEKSVLDIDEPKEGLVRIKNTIKELMRQTG